MPNLYQFSEVEMLAFILVFLRVVAFIFTWPVFGTEIVPTPVKILISLVTSFVLFPLVAWKSLSTDLSSGMIVFLAFREVSIGLLLGFFSRLFFQALAIGGQIISLSMGLSSAQLFNPSLNIEGSAIEQFKIMLGSLFFLFINGHHYFLSGMAMSFDLVPLSAVGINLQAFSAMGPIVTAITVIGIKISAPVMIAILFMNISMGIVGRAVPQINVLVTSLPVNIMVGFAALIVSLPLFIYEMQDILKTTTEQLFELMKRF